MTRNIFAVLLAVLIAVVMCLNVSSVTASDTLTGVWVGTDIFDGSTLRVSFSSTNREGEYHFHSMDSATRSCGVDENGEPLYRINSAGTAILDSDGTLHMEGWIRCLSKPPTPPPYPVPPSTYDAATDTISMPFFGVLYRR